MDQWKEVVFNKYAEFDGRARRQEYWMFVLFNVIFGVVANIVDAIVGLPILGVLYTLAVLIPNIAAGIRRLHDTGRSGWFLLIGLIPCVGAIILIVFLAQDSQPGDNQYGPNPKGA